MSPFVYAIPVFLLLINIEVCAGIIRRKNYNPATSIELKVYAAVQYAVLILATTALVAASHMNPLWLNLFLTCLLAINLIIIGWLLERNNGLQKLEIIRFGLSVSGLAICCWLMPAMEYWLWQFVLGWSGLSLVIMKSLGINQPVSAQPQ